MKSVSYVLVIGIFLILLLYGTYAFVQASRRAASPNPASAPATGVTESNGPAGAATPGD